MRRLWRIFAAAGLIALAACSAPKPAVDQDVADLTRSIMALDPQVDPQEAARAARIAYDHTFELAVAYEITDPPLVHNSKVNAGLKPRGLCWHWAEDMEKRLNSEQFETLELHRAIANADNRFRIDHSTAIISARGETMVEGIVLDPWRKGGRLFWAPLVEDTKYKWEPRQEVLSRKAARARAKRARP
ncbi:MAG: hypothetical protein AAF408_11200 [Pseudomonadota bacterium]